MNDLLHYLYTFGVMTVGFLFGAAIKTIIDKDALSQLSQDNKALRRTNAYLLSRKKGTIEIIYADQEPENGKTAKKDLFDPF